MRLLLLSLFTMALLLPIASAHASHDSDPNFDSLGSYKQQQEEYRKHNYDTQQNSPLPEAQEYERRRKQTTEPPQHQPRNLYNTPWSNQGNGMDNTGVPCRYADGDGC